MTDMPRYVVTVRGIGEPMQANMLSRFVNRLGEGWRHVEVPYPAAYGFVNGQANPSAPDYETTKRLGRAQVRVELSIIAAEDPDATVVLAGYSAGADIVDDLASSGIMAEFLQVKLAVVVANPSNPGSNGLADYGIAAPTRGRQYVDSRVIAVNLPVRCHSVLSAAVPSAGHRDPHPAHAARRPVGVGARRARRAR